MDPEELGFGESFLGALEGTALSFVNKLEHTLPSHRG